MKKYTFIGLLILFTQSCLAQFDISDYQNKLITNASDSIIESYWDELKSSDKKEVLTRSSGNYDSVMQLNMIKANMLLNKYGMHSLDINNVTPIVIFAHNHIPASNKRSWSMVVDCYNTVNEKRATFKASKTHEFQYLLESLFLAVYDKSVYYHNVDSLAIIVNKKLPTGTGKPYSIYEFTDDYNQLIEIRSLKNIDTIGIWERVQLKEAEPDGEFRIVKKTDGHYYQEFEMDGLLYPKRMILTDEDFVLEEDFMNWKFVIQDNGNLILQNEFGTEILNYNKIDN